MLNANIQHLHLAITGKVDFIKKTNPWGAPDEPLAPEAGDPAQALEQIKAFVATRQEDQRRNGKGRK